jgi:ubiquinone/menaquinone biosynthesis C-methylase UbiE
MLQETRSHLKDMTSTPALLRGDAFSLPFRDGAFSAALSFRFIMMFSEKDRARIYRELRRVLRPQGTMIFDYRILRPREKERTEHAFEKLTLSQLGNEIGENGFSLQRIIGNRFGTHHLFPKPLRQSRLFNQAISWLDVRVLNRFPFLLKRCRGGVVVCEKR